MHHYHSLSATRGKRGGGIFFHGAQNVHRVPGLGGGAGSSFVPQSWIEALPLRSLRSISAVRAYGGPVSGGDDGLGVSGLDARSGTAVPPSIIAGTSNKVETGQKAGAGIRRRRGAKKSQAVRAMSSFLRGLKL